LRVRGEADDRDVDERAHRADRADDLAVLLRPRVAAVGDAEPEAHALHVAALHEDLQVGADGGRGDAGVDAQALGVLGELERAAAGARDGGERAEAVVGDEDDVEVGVVEDARERAAQDPLAEAAEVDGEAVPDGGVPDEGVAAVAGVGFADLGRREERRGEVPQLGDDDAGRALDDGGGTHLGVPPPNRRVSRDHSASGRIATASRGMSWARVAGGFVPGSGPNSGTLVGAGGMSSWARASLRPRIPASTPSVYAL
jgi:hypothetical protein